MDGPKIPTYLRVAFRCNLRKHFTSTYYNYVDGQASTPFRSEASELFMLLFSPRSSADLKFYLTEFVDEVEKLTAKLSALRDLFRGRRGSGNAEVVDNTVPYEYNENHLDVLKEDHETVTEGSEEPRDPRAPWVKFKVGQVVRHKLYKYRGVIVAWDEKARAPEWWLTQVHKGNKRWATKPNYLVLIDSRDRRVPQLAYVVEENINVISDQSIIHPLVQKYFEGFDGVEYRLRPWLRDMYPFG